LDESIADWESADLYFDQDYVVDDYYDSTATTTDWEPANG